MTDDATYRRAVERGNELERERDAALAECERLRAQVEIERMRLAGCGVAAMQNTEAGKADRITKDNPYWSASYGDVCRAVDAEIEARENYLGACETIAKMHAAAVGEITGPIRGVVEDVADIKLKLDLSLAECAKITELNHGQWLALENIRTLAARNRSESWAVHVIRWCAEAGSVHQALRDAAIDAARKVKP